MMPIMIFYAGRNPDGTIHVQNMLMGQEGQHHVHNVAGFAKWKAQVKARSIEKLTGACDCGLKAGQCRSHTGRITKIDYSAYKAIEKKPKKAGKQ